MARHGMEVAATDMSTTSVPFFSGSTPPVGSNDTTISLTEASQGMGARFMSPSIHSTFPSQHYTQSQTQYFSSQPLSGVTSTLELDASRANALWRSRFDLITRALEAWTPENDLALPTFATDDASATAFPETDEISHPTMGPAPVSAISAICQHLPSNRASENNTTGAVFDEDQQAAIDAALKGESFFLTGSAGTGKSYVLKKIIHELRRKQLKVAVTASTGCAAVAIQGCTIHSACGVGLGLDSVEILKKKARMRHVQKRLLAPDVLIIDEVSMLDAILFDKVEAMYATGRTHFSAVSVLGKRRHGAPAFDPNKPFGGLQVIVCGDFFQLPPVAPSDAKLQYSQQKMFAFESKAWRRTVQKTFVLRRVHRQADRNFIGLLNELRHGIVSRHTMRVLSACRVKGAVNEVDDDGRPVCYTKLYAFRRQVDSENERRLAELPTQAVAYCASDSIERDDLGILTEKAVITLLENVNVSNRVVLKKGARVLCMKNIDQASGIVNGSAGTVIGFTMGKEELMKRRFAVVADRMRHSREAQVTEESENGDLNNLTTTLPEEKSAPTWIEQSGKEKVRDAVGENGKGSTRDAAERISKEKVRDDLKKGMAVKARGDSEGNSGEKAREDVESNAGLEKNGDSKDENAMPTLRNIHVMEPMSIDGLMEDEIVDLDHESLRKYRENKKFIGVDGLLELDCRCGEALPVVRFDNGVVATMHEESWNIIGMRGQEVAARRQIPLALGWAMTIHKAQGMTLDKVETDVGKAFDFGQVYVALSRAVSMQGLRITTFNASKVMAHEKVKQFYADVYDSPVKTKRRISSKTLAEEKQEPPVHAQKLTQMYDSPHKHLNG